MCLCLLRTIFMQAILITYIYYTLTICLQVINTLRKLCNHPVLLTDDDTSLLQHRGVHSMIHNNNTITQKFSNNSQTGHNSDPLDGVQNANNSNNNTSNGSSCSSSSRFTTKGGAPVRWEDSGKLQVLQQILPLWHSQGHKLLVFSQTRRCIYMI